MNIQYIASGKKLKVLQVIVPALVKELKLEQSRYELIIGLEKGLLKNQSVHGVTGNYDKTIGMKLDSGMKMRDFLSTLAHEMVHVKQIAKGQFKMNYDLRRERAFWLGKSIDRSKFRYIDLPWEREAYKLQEILVRRICSN